MFIDIFYFDLFSIYFRNIPSLAQAGGPWDQPELMTGLAVFYAPMKFIWSNA